MKNSVQLITYADRLGGSLSGSREVISRYFGAAVGGIHFLPFFRPFDGADAGFDPEDHTTVDPRLGSWADLAQISHTYDVMVDVIVNHMSSSSPQFQDFVKNGCTSQYADLFLTFRDVFPDGATEEALSTIYRPRPGLPFTTMRIGDSRRLMWTTFTPQQIDINVRSESGTAYLDSILDQLARAGVSTVRMDAVGYAVKTGGTSSFLSLIHI